MRADSDAFPAALALLGTVNVHVTMTKKGDHAEHVARAPGDASSARFAFPRVDLDEFRPVVPGKRQVENPPGFLLR
jgi:hypothetical protein